MVTVASVAIFSVLVMRRMRGWVDESFNLVRNALCVLEAALREESFGSLVFSAVAMPVA